MVFLVPNYRSLNDNNIFDHGCLRLAFNLASWGMLRGGAFLLQKDYRVHEYFLNDIVKNPVYHHYHDHESQINMTEDNIKGIDILIEETSNSNINIP